MTTGSAKKTRVKRVKTHSLNLTVAELIHLRDLFGLRMPANATRTMSESLAEIEGRQELEDRLWRKVVDLCKACSLPIGDEAPDYMIAVSAPPELGVFAAEKETDVDIEEREEE